MDVVKAPNVQSDIATSNSNGTATANDAEIVSTTNSNTTYVLKKAETSENKTITISTSCGDVTISQNSSITTTNPVASKKNANNGQASITVRFNAEEESLDDIMSSFHQPTNAKINAVLPAAVEPKEIEPPKEQQQQQQFQQQQLQQELELEQQKQAQLQQAQMQQVQMQQAQLQQAQQQQQQQAQAAVSVSPSISINKLNLATGLAANNAVGFEPIGAGMHSLSSSPSQQPQNLQAYGNEESNLRQNFLQGGFFGRKRNNV